MTKYTVAQTKLIRWIWITKKVTIQQAITITSTIYPKD